MERRDFIKTTAQSGIARSSITNYINRKPLERR